MDAFGRGRAVGRQPTAAAVLVGDERGSVAIEYALLAAIVAILAIGGLQALGAQTGGLFEVIDQINQAIVNVLA